METIFIETNCTIKHKGKKFTSGGAFIWPDKTGKLRGIVYGDWNKEQVTNWHGDIKIQATYGPVYRSNFGDKRRSVWFRYVNHNFYGVWCGIDNTQVIRVHEVK